MDFDVVICDEAHRTTGVTIAGADESHFVKLHDNSYLRARKRPYMTATPRVFGDAVRRKAEDATSVLARTWCGRGRTDGRSCRTTSRSPSGRCRQPRT